MPIKRLFYINEMLQEKLDIADHAFIILLHYSTATIKPFRPRFLDIADLASFTSLPSSVESVSIPRRSARSK